MLIMRHRRSITLPFIEIAFRFENALRLGKRRAAVVNFQVSLFAADCFEFRLRLGGGEFVAMFSEVVAGLDCLRIVVILHDDEPNFIWNSVPVLLLMILELIRTRLHQRIIDRLPISHIFLIDTLARDIRRLVRH
jgi:hypothetical protein